MVKTAVASLEAAGINPKALRIAVAAFVAESRDAKDENGRYMGAAHNWLTTKRGWEAYVPSGDALFLDGRSDLDAQWLYRVRSWQRATGYWKMKWDEFGPEPDQAGCRVPSAILDYCLATPTLPPNPSKRRDAEEEDCRMGLNDNKPPEYARAFSDQSAS